MSYGFKCQKFPGWRRVGAARPESEPEQKPSDKTAEENTELDELDARLEGDYYMTYVV